MYTSKKKRIAGEKKRKSDCLVYGNAQNRT